MRPPPLKRYIQRKEPRTNFTFRMPENLAQCLEKIADRRAISMNELIIQWLERDLKRRKDKG